MRTSRATPLPPPAAVVRWDERARWRVQVHGATGLTGRELVRALLEAGHPPARLALYARGARTLEWRGAALSVERAPAQPPAAELAFLCTPPDAAAELGARLAARGTRVIDLSGGWAADAAAGNEATLVLDGCNVGLGGPGELGAFDDRLALPRPTTALVAPALALLERAAGLIEVGLLAVVSAAAGGAREVLALRAELAGRADSGGAPSHEPDARVGNLRPAEEPFPGIERALDAELRALLGGRGTELALDVCALAGDVERCDFFAVRARLERPLAPEEARELFATAESLRVLDGGRAPIPAECAGAARVQVGRIRQGSAGARSLCFSAAGDPLRAGSSLAALRVAARLPAAG